MNRVKLILKLVNSLSSTQKLGLNQVTHSYNTQSFFIRKPQSYYICPNLHQNLHFSSFAQLILSSNDWSDEIEDELEILNPRITHEFVVYVLKNLNKNPHKSLAFFKWVRHKKGFQPNNSPYCILLRTLASQDFREEFWAVALELKEKGFCIDGPINGAIIRALELEKMGETLSQWVEFYKSLRVVDDGKDEIVKGVVEVILGGDWSEEVESKLNNLEFPLSCDFLFRVIWKLRDEPLKSIKFFEWVASYLKYEHNSITYGGMARVLAQRGLMDEFWDLVIRMRTEGCEIDIETYVKITRRVGNVDAVKLFEFMLDGPYKLSEQECVWLLKILAHENEPDMNLVMRVINKYLEVGNSYTEGIYIGIHRVMCKLGRFDEAKKIMEDMKKAGHEPDNITYSQEIFGLCKYSRFEDARLVFNQMETEGCIPDIKTWTVLIQGYFSVGEVEQALSCFVEMLQKNIAPDADILEVLINGFLNHNKLLGAYKILVEMAYKARLKPWQATYKHMIEMLLKDGKLEEAHNLLSMMMQVNYPPYIEPFVAYISKYGTVVDAKNLLRALPMKGPSSTAAYVKVISSFFEKGRHSEARDLIYHCPHHVLKEQKIQIMVVKLRNNSDMGK